MADIKGAQLAARKLLKELGISSLPVPVKRIARQLEIEVRRERFDGDVSGMMYKSDDGEKVIIGINSMHHSNRQRFTIAHEIGHYRLNHANIQIDKGLMGFLRDEVSSLAIEDEEIEANQFAAELLMPEELVLKSLKGIKFSLDDDEFNLNDFINSMARKFRVSPKAFTYRLVNLGLIDQDNS